MSRSLLKLTSSALLVTSALTVPALAQETTGAEAAQDCQDLTRLIEENSADLTDEWEEQARLVAQSNQTEQCAQYYQDARSALDELQAQRGTSNNQTPQQGASSEQDAESGTGLRG